MAESAARDRNLRAITTERQSVRDENPHLRHRKGPLRGQNPDSRCKMTISAPFLSDPGCKHAERPKPRRKRALSGGGDPARASWATSLGAIDPRSGRSANAVGDRRHFFLAQLDPGCAHVGVQVSHRARARDGQHLW